MHNAEIQEYRAYLDGCVYITDKEKADLIAQYREYLDQLDYDVEFLSIAEAY